MDQYTAPNGNIFANSVRNAQRAAFQRGYLTAEEGLALTWEDMVLLRTLFDAVDASQSMGALIVQPMTREYYEFLLQEFNKMKNK